MPTKENQGGQMGRESALAIMRSLQEYMYPEDYETPSGEAESAIKADRPVAQIDENHILRLLVKDYTARLPDKLLPIEGRELWHSLVQSTFSAPEKTRELAKEFYRWIGRGVTVHERMVFIEGSDPEACMVILDGQSYVNISRPALGILKALYDARGQYLTSEDLLNRKIPGCHGDEKTIRRHIERIPLSLRRLIISKRSQGRYLRLPEDSSERSR